MEEKLIKVEVRVKKIDYVDKDGNDSNFLSYKGFTKKGWYDLKFTKECKNLPQRYCFIYVKQENLNINFNGRFPVIWVSGIEKTEEIQKNLKTEDYFD